MDIDLSMEEQEKQRWLGAQGAHRRHGYPGHGHHGLQRIKAGQRRLPADEAGEKEREQVRWEVLKLNNAALRACRTCERALDMVTITINKRLDEHEDIPGRDLNAWKQDLQHQVDTLMGIK